MTAVTARERAAAAVVCMAVGAFVTVSGMGGESLADVKRGVESGWRPSYDVLVLAPDAEVTVRSGGRSLIEGNFMSALSGGISVAQWRTVQGTRGVEVAAPVANVGYLQRSRLNVSFPDLSPGVYDVGRRVVWNNGLAARTQFDSPGGQLDARQAGCPQDPPQLVGPAENGDTGTTMRDAQVLGAGANAYGGLSDPGDFPCLGIELGGTYPLFAVDPVEESRLLGLDQAVTAGALPSPGQGTSRFTGYQFCGPAGGCVSATNVPVVVDDQNWVDTRFSYDIRRWDVDTSPPGSLLQQASPAARSCAATDSELGACVDTALQRRLAAAPRRSVVRTTVPDPASITSQLYTYAAGKWTLTPNENTIAQLVSRPSPLAYRPATAPSETGGPWSGAVTAVPTGSYGPEPTFRQQRPVRNDLLRLEVVGHYDSSRVSASLSGRGDWLPENTYRPPTATARFDEAGDPVSAVRLKPTANPLGYLLQPPQALTTIPAAAALLGPAPISAIRVRVSGVDDAGEASWSRVQDAARRIHDSTGLQTVLTLGAAPARVLVHVPGMTAAQQTRQPVFLLPDDPTDGPVTQISQPPRTVAGFGWVEEPWLGQGASISYLRSGARQYSWLMGLLALSCLVYLAASFASGALPRTRSVAVLRAVGWSRARVLRAELARAGLTGLTGAIPGLALGLLVLWWRGLPVRPEYVVAAVPVALILCTSAAVLPALRLARVPLAIVLSAAEGSLTTTRRSPLPATGLPSFALAQLWQLRARAALALASGALATGLALTLRQVRASYSGDLQVTLLGQALLVQTGPVETAVTVLVSVLAAGLLAELLWQSVRDRRRDIGALRAVGWSQRSVGALLACQGGTLGASSGAAGALIAAAFASRVLHQPGLLATLAGTVPVAVVVDGAVGIAAGALPAWLASRLPPADSLRTP